MVSTGARLVLMPHWFNQTEELPRDDEASSICTWKFDYASSKSLAIPKSTIGSGFASTLNKQGEGSPPSLQWKIRLESIRFYKPVGIVSKMQDIALFSFRSSPTLGAIHETKVL